MAGSEKSSSQIGHGNGDEVEAVAVSDSKGQSLVSEICEELSKKGKVLNTEIEQMKSLEGSCMKALEQLHVEQAAWYSKLQSIKDKMSQIEKRKDETTLMLDLHQVLRSSGSLELAVEAVQNVVAAEKETELEHLYTPCEAETGKCAVCNEDISPEEMLLRLRTNYQTHPTHRLTMCRNCSTQVKEEESTSSL